MCQSMPRKRSGRLTEQGLLHPWIFLPLVALIGCSNLGISSSYFESWRQWATRSTASPSDVSTSAPQSSPAATTRKTEPAEESESVSHPVAASEQQAAVEARRASLRAQSAAEAAKKASEQAIDASREASQAAARAGNASPATGTSISTEPAANPSPAASSKIILSSAGDASGEPNRARTAELIRELDQSIAKIKPTTLDSNAAKRKSVAESLVQSAQKAFLQNDYLEANSLAIKASVMLAPLIGGALKADSDP